MVQQESRSEGGQSGENDHKEYDHREINLTTAYFLPH